MPMAPGLLSILFIMHTLNLSIKKNKAVLFESPGVCKNEEELVKTGIISHERTFSLKDLNVVNYLTAPCFANSCNQHVGKVYRLFI